MYIGGGGIYSSIYYLFKFASFSPISPFTNLKSKSSEYVEWPAHRSFYGFIREDVQKQARGPPEKNSLDGRQSNRNRTHRPCVSLGVFPPLKTVYLIGYRDTSNCPLYIYTYTYMAKSKPHDVWFQCTSGKWWNTVTFVITSSIIMLSKLT